MENSVLTKLLLGVVLIASLAHVAGAVTLTVAAGDSSAAARASADYVCDGVNDQQEIQAALNALPATGGEVILTEGNFLCAGDLAPRAHSTLRGQGDSKTSLAFTKSARILVDKEHVTLEDFSVSGKGYTINPYGGVITIRASHAMLRDISGTADSSIQGVFYVVSESASGYHQQITDLEFTRCTAINPGTYGFLMSASEYKTIKNVVFTECEAINCGRYNRYDPWVTGFDFAELNNLENVDIIRCRAEGSWESGFHFETMPSKINVRLIDCISNNNAQVQKITGAEPDFGAGYLLSKDISCINCTSENNFIGFLCSSGGNTIERCSDMGSVYGLSIVGTPGLKVVSTSLTGEARPIQVRSGTTNLLMDDLKISSGGSTIPNPGINVESSVAQANSIQVKNSNIQGYRYGVYNSASAKIQIQNVNVNGAITAFVNCAILSTPTPAPTPTPTASEPTTSVRFTSSPSGATICLDDKYVGATPATISGITMGTHTVEIKMDDYQTWTKTFQVTEAWTAQTYSFNPTLNPAAAASVLFTSSPSDAAIYLDDKYVGTTPATIPGVTMGTHFVEIKKNGYQIWTWTFQVTEAWTAKTYSFNPTLKKI